MSADAQTRFPTWKWVMPWRAISGGGNQTKRQSKHTWAFHTEFLVPLAINVSVGPNCNFQCRYQPNNLWPHHLLIFLVLLSPHIVWTFQQARLAGSHWCGESNIRLVESWFSKNLSRGGPPARRASLRVSWSASLTGARTRVVMPVFDPWVWVLVCAILPFFQYSNSSMLMLRLLLPVVTVVSCCLVLNFLSSQTQLTQPPGNYYSSFFLNIYLMSSGFVWEI